MGDNGAAVNEGLTADPHRAPWWDVDPGAVIQNLSAQLAAQAQEMAAMRAYIGQLHQALASMSAVPAEEPRPAGQRA